VLVDGRLDRRSMRRGIGLSILAAAATLAALLAVAPIAAMATIAVSYILFALLALSYTVPPLKLSHRGLGEVTVAITHSAGAILAGYVVQGAAWTDSTPWLLSLPLGLSVLPSILLAGCPDKAADQAVGKRTLVVSLGHRAAIRLAMAMCLAAPALAALLVLTRMDMAALLGWSVAGGSVHAAWLWRCLLRLSAGKLPERIDGPIALALTFILWFCVPPLVVLMRTSGT
jgi:1,4-dihydroxy-2-naphthoate octaprenyltransferase